MNRKDMRKRLWGSLAAWLAVAGVNLPLPQVDEKGRLLWRSPEGLRSFSSGSRLRRQTQAGSSMSSVGQVSSPPSQSAGTPKAGSATSRPSDDLGYLKSVDLVAFNQSAEQAFVEIVRRFLQEEGQPQPMVAVLAEAAFELDISTETAKRYLVKHSARRAEFRLEDKLVWLRQKGDER